MNEEEIEKHIYDIYSKIKFLKQFLSFLLSPQLLADGRSPNYSVLKIEI